MRKKSSKTHVFPYTALEPFVTVTPKGNLEVKSYVGDLRPDLREDISKLNARPNDEDLFNRIRREIEILRETLQETSKPPPPNELADLVGERVRREVSEALRRDNDDELVDKIRREIGVLKETLGDKPSEEIVDRIRREIDVLREVSESLRRDKPSDELVDKIRREIDVLREALKPHDDELVDKIRREIDVLRETLKPHDDGDYIEKISDDIEKIAGVLKTSQRKEDDIGEIRRSLMEHDGNVVRRFDDVINRITQIDLGEEFRGRLNEVLKDGEVTRSELSNASRSIMGLLADVSTKKDVEAVMKLRPELIKIKELVESIDVNSKLPDFQRTVVEQLNGMFSEMDEKMKKLIVFDDVVSSVNLHSSSELERVFARLVPGATPQEVSQYVDGVKDMVREMQASLSELPEKFPSLDLSEVLGAISGITLALEANEAERKRLSDMTDELSRVRQDMDRMINTLYDRLSQHHETQTEVVLNKLKEGNQAITDKVGEYGGRMDELISRMSSMEQYLRSIPPEKKLDVLDDVVDRCEGLDELKKSMDDIFKDLGVNDVGNAREKIQDLLKISQEKKRATAVYTSSPNLKDILKYDEEKVGVYRRTEVGKFVKLGIQVFDLRVRFTKLVHSSVFLRDRLTVLSNLPRGYEPRAELEANLETRDEIVVLQDAFSPVFPAGEDAGEMAIASMFQRSIHLERVVGLLAGDKKMIASELLKILRRRGSDIREGYHLYTIDEMFDVVFSLINNAREFVRTAQSKESIVEGTPARYALVNAFVDAVADSLANVQALNDLQGSVDTQLKLPQHVISYVKVRADGGDMDGRYSVNLDRPAEKMLLAHEPYVTSTLSTGALKNHYQYDVYGPHTRIFTHRQDNEDMASNMSEMVSEIDAGKNIMLITLGPSGSGKTSTILYFRDEKQAGILPRLLSQVSSAKYTQATLVGYELAANYDREGKMYWMHYDVFDSPVRLSRDALREWRVASTSDRRVLDYSAGGVCEVADPYTKVDRKSIRVESGKSIGDLMADIIDMRLNCGTKNNPFSSRTHLFIFIKIENGPNIVVGDLAGRENTFDCESYDTLLNLVSNKLYYPDLYKEISDVDEIIALTNLRPRASADTPPEEVGDADSAIRMGNWLNLADNFRYPMGTDGYFLVNMDKKPKESGMDMKFYGGMSRLLRYLGEFITDLKRRLENIDSELPPVRARLEDLLKHKSKLELTATLMSFFRDKFAKPIVNFHVEDFFRRFNRYAKAEKSEFMAAFKLIPRVIEYLLTVKVIEERVVRGRAREACQVRNLEGVFINRSLDEITDFARMLVLSGPGTQGPPVHESCLPVSCGFAGMDCLIPKKNLRPDAKSVLMELFDKVNIRIDPAKTSLCLMTVLNFTTPARHKVPHVYRPIEDILEKIHAAYLEKERLRDVYYDELRPINFNFLSDKLKTILSLMDNEEGAKIEYRTRKEYRGTTEEYMLRPTDVQTLYDRSYQNWTDMRRIGDEILEMISAGMYPNDPRLDELMAKTVRPTIKRYQALNTETIPGTLRTCEYIMKAADHLACSVADVDEILRDNDSWRSRPSKVL